MQKEKKIRTVGLKTKHLLYKSQTASWRVNKSKKKVKLFIGIFFRVVLYSNNGVKHSFLNFLKGFLEKNFKLCP